MYLSTKEIAAMQAVRRVHQLNSAAIRLDKSLGDEAGLKNIGIHLITIAPGEKSTEFHSHKYEDEAIYVLSGHGTEAIGDETYKSNPAISSGFRPAGRRMKRSTMATNRSFASSSAKDWPRMSSIIRVEASDFIGTAGSGI